MARPKHSGCWFYHYSGCPIRACSGGKQEFQPVTITLSIVSLPMPKAFEPVVAYDKFNHLTGATASSGPFSGLALSWTYDRYGNRASQSAGGSYGGTVYQGGFNFTSNRISSYCYDAAGNLLDMQSCTAVRGHGFKNFRLFFR